MDTIKKCDTRKRLSAGRKTEQRSFRSAGKADRAISSKNDLDGIRVGCSTFAEDFMMEHCSAALHVTLIGVAGGSAVAAKDTQPSTQHFGFPS